MTDSRTLPWDYLSSGFVLVLTSVSGAYAGSIQFTDPFNGSTLDPFWNANVQQEGYITFPSAAEVLPGCSQSVQFNSAGSADWVSLTHNFPGMTYGDASVWFYDTAAVPYTQGAYYTLLLGTQNPAGFFPTTCASLFTQNYDFPGNGDTYWYHVNWTNGESLDSASSVERTQGWHEYEIDDTATSLTMSVDGVLVYSASGGVPFNAVTLGMFGAYAPVTYWDDFSFNGDPAPVPEPGTLTLLVSALLGLGAFHLRRRRAKG